jgi:hypothetical protein
MENENLIQDKQRLPNFYIEDRLHYSLESILALTSHFSRIIQQKHLPWRKVFGNKSGKNRGSPEAGG